MKLKKITKRVNGREKKGVSGNAIKFISSAKAIKRLQVTPADFRRLCILKGIFPRPAPKGAKAKDKTYYHLKDIQFMAHEPILHKYRELKIYLRKKTRFLARREESLASSLEAPVMKIDHLVKERYPNFMDAIRDLDDALTMLFLFNALRVRVHLSYVDERASMVNRLIKEWRKIVEQSKALTKVFVSVKGYYYQADIKGTPVTWLVPHATVQNTPQDVDYSVMSTFLEFYEALLRCVNFKLYKEDKIVYPPTFTNDDEKNAAIAFFKTDEKKVVVADKKGKKSANAQVELSAKAKAKINAANKKDVSMDDEEEEAEDKTLDEFHQLDPNALKLVNDEQKAISSVFAEHVFLINREVPFEAVSFVIRCGGGIALREVDLSAEQLRSKKITYHVVDRPSISSVLPGRKYVQPQYIFDCFNERFLLPTEPYGIGAKLPPHLSPFVDDVREGYVPDQRNVLRQWAGLKPLKDSVLEKIDKSEEQMLEEVEAQEEADYQSGLKKEMDKKKTEKKRPAAQQHVEDEEEIELEADEEFGDDEDEEEDGEIDEDDEEEDVEDEDEEEIVLPTQKPKPAPKPNTFNPKDNAKELSKIVMNKKDKRLLTRMEFGIKRKENQGKALHTKKRAAETGDIDPVLPKNMKSRRLR